MNYVTPSTEMQDAAGGAPENRAGRRPSALGLSHVTFVVRDLERMATILTTVLGARQVYDSGDKTYSLSPERFFVVGEGENSTWVAIMQGERDVARSYDHVAFRVAAEDLEAYRQAVESLGLDVRESRARVEGEGQSLYFHDDDGHLFELHTGTLAERLARYARD